VEQPHLAVTHRKQAKYPRRILSWAESNRRTGHTLPHVDRDNRGDRIERGDRRSNPFLKVFKSYE